MKKILLIVAGLIFVVAVLGVSSFLLSNMITAAAIEQEWKDARVEKIRELGTTRTFEILPLFEEAKARDDLELEHGVSYLVKTDELNILLDVGMTPARLSHNMRALGVSEKDFDAVVITHPHPDHMGGTGAWWSNTLMVGDPPLDLTGKRVMVPMSLSSPEIALSVLEQPTKIAQGAATIGTLPFAEVFPLSLRSPRSVEQALAVNVEGRGIVLITGCGHPTIEQLVTRADAVFDEPIVGIIGGLHYEGFTREQTQPHLAFIDALDPQLVALSPHDSSAPALDAFREAFRDVYREIRVGEWIRFEEPVTSR